MNEDIRVSPVRLVDEEGEQVGVVSLDEARDLAADRNLDMVEVAPNARPPVVRLMDYGRFKYEQAKAEKEAKKRQHTVEVKEVKFRPKIEDHDFDFKTRHAREFIEQGNKVKVTIMFRYRELRRPELGIELLDRITEQLGDIAQVQSRSGLEGRNMTMMLVPQGWEV
ncbi:MAG: translation initiation factor IF-3 [Candidatus Palauibacterales bacterium]|nr:translation initiation factor IF-3 [Candidatus Palauibacterales bacterium]MDP2530651.1 translation initiation factor IF-3 [Candidatus Palauibacterales bacterium]MDP2583550.1 translation initiation factor IF-3 [Candidatus Palauibacterales bacterium]